MEGEGFRWLSGASGPWPCLALGALRHWGGEREGMSLMPLALRGPTSDWQLERILSLWIPTCSAQQGERNADSPLWGDGSEVRPSRRAIWQSLSKSWKDGSLWPSNSMSENFSEGNKHSSGVIGVFFVLFCFVCTACCSLQRKIGNQCPTVGN